MISSVIKSSLFKTPFKFTSFQRIPLQNGSQISYNFILRVSSYIKMTKQKKEFQIDINVDPEKPFDIKLENIILKDSLEQPSNSHIRHYFNVLKDKQYENWVLQLIEIFIQGTLDSLHERTQMMYTDDTQYYRHEIQKQMNIDEQDLKRIPELDLVISEKYFSQTNILFIPLTRPQPYLIGQFPQGQMGGMRNPQKMYPSGQNMGYASQSPNMGMSRIQSGNPYDSQAIPQQARGYMPQLQKNISINQQGGNVIQQQQIHPQMRSSHPNQYYQQVPIANPNLGIPVSNQIPRQNSQQPVPVQISGGIPPGGQDMQAMSRLRQNSQTSQPSSMGQIPPQQNSNPNIIATPRSIHQKPLPGQIQQQGPIPHLQKQQTIEQQIQYGPNQHLPPQQQQSSAIISQNPNQAPPQAIPPQIPGQPYNQYMGPPISNAQGHMHQQQIHQQQHQLPHGVQQQIPIGVIPQQINNGPQIPPPQPNNNLQPPPPPPFDPNIVPNAYGQYPAGMVPRQNHPIAPKNY